MSGYTLAELSRLLRERAKNQQYGRLSNPAWNALNGTTAP